MNRRSRTPPRPDATPLRPNCYNPAIVCDFRGSCPTSISRKIHPTRTGRPLHPYLHDLHAPPMLRFAVVASLAVNLVLGATLLWRHPPATPESPAARAPSFAIMAEPASNPEPTVATWPQVDAPQLDDAAYVARLRAAGLPPYALRALLRDRLYQRNHARWRALADEAAALPFWQGRQNNDVPFAIRRKAIALTNEEEEARRTLLGADSRNLMSGLLDLTFDTLPEEKRAGLMQLLKDYEEMSNALHAETAGLVLPADRALFATLEQEQTADLAALLTPDELADFRRRASPTARTVQRTLAYFDATESEYLALLILREQIDAAYGTNTMTLTRAERQERDQAWVDTQDAFAATLPADRAEQFRIATSPEYPATARFVVKHDLPPATTVSLLQITRATTAQQNRIQQDSTLAPAERQIQLLALAREADAQVAAHLAGAALDDYRGSIGKWLPELITESTPEPTP